MFMKQYNYKPRSMSQSSTGSQEAAAKSDNNKNLAATATTATTAGKDATGGVAAAVGSAGRRRSSASGAEKFAGLSAHKRGSGQDEIKKAAWADQKPGSQGILGGMWTNFTKGSS